MISKKLQKTISFFSAILLLAGAVFLISQAPSAHATTGIEPIYKVLTPGSGGTFTGMGDVVAKIWQVIMNTCNAFVLAFLIYVAFMNILRIQMDSYAVKKILPTFIMAIILANFSFLIVRVLLDLGNIVISFFLYPANQVACIGGSGSATSGTVTTSNQITGAFDSIMAQQVPNPEGFTGNYWGALTAYLFKQLAMLFGAVMVAILAFIFIVRNYFIYFLTAIAPAAFMAMVLPMTKKYFQQWWGQITKWIFMPVVSIFWLWLGGSFICTAGTLNWVLPIVFACLCFYMAMTTPFKVGGAAVGTWAKAGKQLGNWTKKTGYNQIGGVGQRLSATGQLMQKKYTDKNDWHNKLGNALNKTGGVVNVPASVNAWKENRKNYYGNMKKAEVKTPVYTRIAGSNARIEAQKARHEDTLKYPTPENTAEEMIKIEKAIMEAVENPGEKSAQKVNMRLQLMDMIGAKGDNAEEIWNRASLAKKNNALRTHLATEGAGNLKTKYQGLGGQLKNESDAVLAEGYARNFMKLSQGRTRTELAAAYEEDPDRDYDPLTDQNRRLLVGPRPRTQQTVVPSTTLGGPQAVTSPELEEINASVQDVVDALKAKNDSEDDNGATTNQAMAEASQPEAGVFAAVNSRQHVVIDDVQNISPQVAEKLRRVQKSANSEFVKVQQQSDRTLSTVAQAIKSGQTPEEMTQLVGQGRQMLARGDVQGAKEIALQINPSAEQSLNLTGGSENE